MRHGVIVGRWGEWGSRSYPWGSEASQGLETHTLTGISSISWTYVSGLERLCRGVGDSKSPGKGIRRNFSFETLDSLASEAYSADSLVRTY